MSRTVRSAFIPVGVPFLIALAVAACGGAGGQLADPGAAGSMGNPSPEAANTAAPGSAPGAGVAAALVSPTCRTADPSHVCLGTKWVSYKDSNGAAVLTEDQALSNLETMNQIWSQCNLGFQIEEYDQVDPARYNFAFGSEAENQLDQIRNQFNNGHTLLSVTTGPWNDVKNAWTAMPGSPPYGAVMEASIVDYGNGIIYAHEFGHYLGLDHVPDPSDLMDAIIYTNSRKLTQSQCDSARQTAQTVWTAMLR